MIDPKTGVQMIGLPAVEEMLVESGFDYSQIEVAHRAAVREAAQEIKARAQRVQSDLIEIGKRLLAIKEILPHNKFGAWCQAEFDMSHRMAQNLMNVARTYGNKPGEKISLFSPSVLYLLSGPDVPDEARDEAERRAQAGEKITVADAKAIAAAQRAPDKPEPGYVPIWNIEQLVKRWLRSMEEEGKNADAVLAITKNLTPCDLTRDLLDTAKGNLGGPYRKGDMMQAINNIIDQRREETERLQAETEKSRKVREELALEAETPAIKSLDELPVVERATELVPVPSPALPMSEDRKAERREQLSVDLSAARVFRNGILPRIGELTGEFVAVNRAKAALDPLIEALERNLAAHKETPIHE